MERNTTNSLVPFQPFQLGRMKLRHTLSLTTFSPPWTGGIFGTYRLTGLRIRSYVPTQTSIQILGTQGDMFIVRRTRKHFFEKKCSKWDSNSCPAVDANCKRQALVRWATGKRSTHRLPKLSLITVVPRFFVYLLCWKIDAVSKKSILILIFNFLRIFPPVKTLP